MNFDLSSAHPILKTIQNVTDNFRVYTSLFKIDEDNFIQINIEAFHNQPVAVITTQQKTKNLAINTTYTVYLSGETEIDISFCYIDNFTASQINKNIEIVQYSRNQSLGLDECNEFLEVKNALDEINKKLSSPKTTEMDPLHPDKKITQYTKDMLTLTYEEIYSSQDEIRIPEPDTTTPQ